jgi:SAM-dependent methyltransferase
VLKYAQTKLSGINNVDLIQCSLTEGKKLPFSNGTFDVVMVNQVMQYLDKDFTNYPNARFLLVELCRVMKPGGTILINTCTRAMVDSYWYIDLSPNCRDIFTREYMALDQLAKFMIEAGFDQTIRAHSIPEPLQGLKYFNLMGPLDNVWRFGSNLEYGGPEIIRTKLVELLNAGKLGQYFDDHDKFRRENGQTVFVIGQAPAVATKVI